MKKLIIPILALSAIFTSCQLNNNQEPAPANQNLTFTHAGTKINAGADNVFVNDDKIGITMTESKSTTPTTANNLYTYTGTVFTAAEADVIKYTGEGEFDFYAYYPFEGVSKTSAPVVISVVDQDDTNNKDIFALRAVAIGEKKAVRSEIPLTFNRLTSKITFNVIKGTGIHDLTNLSKVELINFTSETTLDVVAGTFSSAKKEPITGKLTGTTENGTGVVYILATDAANDLKFIFTLDGKAYECKLTSGTSFVAGKNYTYAITISTSEVTAKPTIADWTTEDKGGANAER